MRNEKVNYFFISHSMFFIINFYYSLTTNLKPLP